MPISNTHYAAQGARAHFYQGTAAIASWLSGLAANTASNSKSASKTSSSSSHSLPTISSGAGSTPYNQFRSQVGATAAAVSPDAPASGNAADYQQAIAAYGES